MNFLDYLVNAMTGGQPTQQELIARKMAQEENKNQTLQGLLSPQVGASLEPIKITPEMIDEMRRNMTPPISGQGQTANQYKQNLLNPSMTMQQNYIDPKLIEMMYYKSLLNK